MKLPTHLAKRLRRTLADAAGFLGDHGDPAAESTGRDCRDLLERLTPRAAPVKALPGVSRSVQRRVRVQTRKAATAAIRAAVFTRAGDVCELCRLDPPTELHHLEPGANRRRLQSVANTIAACRQCHRGWHKRPADFDFEVHQWAARNGLPIPRRHAK